MREGVVDWMESMCDVKGKGGGAFERTGVIAADEEVVFVVMAAVERAGLEVVAAWWGDVRVGG